ncbi:complex I NDUFA9 subunit family protein [Asticcacaulis sp. ZE23SCel15]|uniref:complex I NDUFA9 subunit family protein n=1 Tax=Asticcacaulis sp. ZE23SCel15 TaxID=3059027 RepID=UPI00265F43D5|nr:complex I NDUFA9 subunit family protein [Asticcacaulis sp. ZE23SCel15]WKL57996.1 complex I NDUFA9 subunit family protein [Asticcacaulis sp. ZE23SCel15]
MAELVTIFGGSGFVGKQVVRALAKQGWRIRVAVRKPTVAYDLKPAGDVGQIQVVRCDVRKEADIDRALEGASAVINLVGILYQSGGQSFDALHRQASATIAQKAAALGIKRFVQMSAIGADPASSSKYAASKGQAEAAVLKAIPTATIVRPSVIFGPQDGFFTSLAYQTKMFPFMPSIGGGKTKFQPVYIGDVAQAFATIMSSDTHFGKTYELGGPKVYSFNDVVKYVGQEVMAPKPLIYMPFFLASAIGIGGDLMAAFGLPPLVTTDQVLLLQKDNVVGAQASGLKALGVAPTAVELVVPGYLWRFRKNGQFAVAVS